MLGKVEPATRPYAYMMTLGYFAAAQIVYMILPILIWFQPDPFAKACAAAMYMITRHISTVRAVHLPLALVSLAVATLSGLVGNTYFLMQGADSSSFALTSVCIVATAYFSQITLTTVHGLHYATAPRYR